jgi:hypothetical protein
LESEFTPARAARAGATATSMQPAQHPAIVGLTGTDVHD